MASDEKRREVARALRRVDVFVDPMDDAEVCDRCEVEYALGLENEDGWYRAYDVHYLADLIEPQADLCWNVSDDNDGGHFHCSECGAVWELTCGTAEENGMRHCPGCGARIITARRVTGSCDNCDTAATSATEREESND